MAEFWRCDGYEGSDCQHCNDYHECKYGCTEAEAAEIEQKEQREKEDFIKSIIQTALWEHYKKSNDINYKRLYEQWYKQYNDIKINGLQTNQLYFD